MRMEPSRKRRIKLLVLEDDPSDLKHIETQTRRALAQLCGDAEIQFFVSKYASEARNSMRKSVFSFAMLDLWVPEDAGAPKADAKNGIAVFREVSAGARSLTGVIWTGHEEIQAGRIAGETGWPYWGKATILNWKGHKDSDIPQVPWADGAQVIARSLQILVDGTTTERIPHAGTYLLQSAVRLAPGLLASLALKLVNRGLVRGRFTGGLNDFALLCEGLQIWLLLFANSWRVHKQRKPIIWPVVQHRATAGSTNGQPPTREALESALAKVLEGLHGGAKQLPPLFVDAVVGTEPTGAITAALKNLRQWRNRVAHEGTADEEQEFVQKAWAVQLVWDALAWVTNHAAVTALRQQGMRWRGDHIAGTGWPWPALELRLPELEEPSVANMDHAYQTWRDEDGAMRLLSLWPLADVRLAPDGKSKAVWIVLTSPDAQGRAWEYDFSQGKAWYQTLDRTRVDALRTMQAR